MDYKSYDERHREEISQATKLGQLSLVGDKILDPFPSIAIS
jgi:hypothetical protein